MLIRRGIPVERATERELLRFRMEKLAARIDERNLGEEGIALAKMCETLDKLNGQRIVRLAVLFYSFVGFCVLVVKLLRSKR